MNKSWALFVPSTLAHTVSVTRHSSPVTGQRSLNSPPPPKRKPHLLKPDKAETMMHKA